MPRWQPDARQRLERAAISLFVEQGFAATTVPEITARAGLTTRTFFRHFADKREVLFAGDEIPRLAADLIAAAPPERGAGDLIVGGLHEVARTRFDGRHAEMRLLRDIVASDPSLHERDLHKRADLAAAIRAGFTARGLDTVRASLLADLTTTVLHVALDAWLADGPERSLTEHINNVLTDLRDAVTDLTGPRA